MPEQLTEIVIERSDLKPLSRPVRLEGIAIEPDGSPAPQTTIVFEQNMGVNAEKSNRFKRITDTDGAFAINGIENGIWWITIPYGPDAETTIDHVVIPADAPDPYPLTIVVPAGSVSGTICDSRSGAPFTADGPRWYVNLLEHPGRLQVSCIMNRQAPGRFCLANIPAGAYKIEINADGYQAYRSDPFTHSGTGDLDLGRIELEPGGVIVMMVVDSSGNPVATYQIFLNGSLFRERHYKILPGDMRRYYRLPPGKNRIEVSAPGFKTVRTEVDLEKGRPGELRLVLERK